MEVTNIATAGPQGNSKALPDAAASIQQIYAKETNQNLDDDSIVYLKGAFEPTVSEELWRECERIRKSGISQYRMPDGEMRRKGIYGTTSKWRCICKSANTKAQKMAYRFAAVRHFYYVLLPRSFKSVPQITCGGS